MTTLLNLWTVSTHWRTFKMPGIIKFLPPLPELVFGYTTGVLWVFKLTDFPGNLLDELTRPHLSSVDDTGPFSEPQATMFGISN